ncbi:hypothetical protein F2Q70_00039575 [Brassica cretica]|uniref:Uncharacterized protein n=1 Tax=Brassica cretica TaxID=69181 RepID=A0A8S9K5I1_BRACR|nr:hypothetical protein F2Q70_00039575 [Brassica cretica]
MRLEPCEATHGLAHGLFLIVFENSYSADFESTSGEGFVQVKRDQFLWRPVQDQSGRSRYLEVGSWQEARYN